MAADAVAVILLIGLTLYAVLAGADFGGGFWDLFAGGNVRGWAPRRLIDDTITPVWEANHVWLIFALVIFWTAFPAAFAAVMTVASLPLWLAVLGIVLRGAGFAFRREVEDPGWQRVLGAVFALSSLLTPFFMGAVIGAVADGRISSTDRSDGLAVWTGSTSILIGSLFVSVCAYLSAVYLIGEASRREDDRLTRYFTRRAEAMVVLSGVLSIGTLIQLRYVDARLYSELTSRAAPLVAIAGLAGVAVLIRLLLRRTTGLRVLSAVGVACVLWGWGVAQYPRLVPGTELTLKNGSAPEGTLIAIVVVFVGVVLLVGPAFLLLFSLHGRRLLEPDEGWVAGGHPS